jgi:TRAP-type C4-dicarboxylate transport system permease small subunit
MDWLRRRADDVAAAMLAAMFAAFIFQIFARYVILRLYPQADIGWTVEVCLTLWLWLVFWGAAFCLNDSDHVKFDILYLAAGRQFRRVLAFGAAIAIAIGMLAALPATLDYITFYKIKSSSVLHIRLDYVFSIYGVFAAATVIRYLWRAQAILRGRMPDETVPGRDPLTDREDSQ